MNKGEEFGKWGLNINKKNIKQLGIWKSYDEQEGVFFILRNPPEG